MTFITGGAYQGKLEFAKKELGFDDENILNELQKKIRDMTDMSAEEIAENILNDDKIKCVICDEVGCGIVPLEKTDRVWRELTGRVGCILAKKADAVYLLKIGIPRRIK